MVLRGKSAYRCVRGPCSISYRRDLNRGAANRVERRFSHLGSRWSHRVAQKIREFGEGLNTIHRPLSLLLLILVSVGMWWMIAIAYHEVTIAYHQTAHVFGEDPLDIPLLQVLLLM